MGLTTCMAQREMQWITIAQLGKGCPHVSAEPLHQDLQQMGQKPRSPTAVVAVELRDLSEGLVGATSCDCWQFSQAF